jgi:hypothetical protein
VEGGAVKSQSYPIIMAGLDPAIHDFLAIGTKDVDARHRRQVYAVCASLTAGRA